MVSSLKKWFAFAFVIAWMVGGSSPVASGQCLSKEIHTLVGSDTEAGDGFGYAVTVDGTVAAVGAPFAFDNINGNVWAGSVYVFRWNGMMWVEEALLVAADAHINQRFGASLSIEGDRLAVGAGNDTADRGAVYIFDRSGGTWSQTQKITSANPAFGDLFGADVSLEGDRVMAGAPLDDPAGLTASGSVEVFDFNGATWVFQQTITPVSAVAGQSFGTSVSLSGTRVLIGSPGDDPACPADPTCDSGSAYIFDFNGAMWTETRKLIPTNPAREDAFGASVSLDDSLALIGSPRDNIAGNNAGSAFMFRHDGAMWQEETELNAGPAAQPGDHFGNSVAVEGDFAVIGAGKADGGYSLANPVDQSGAAYVFHYLAQDPVWVPHQILVHSDAAMDDLFGGPFDRVSLSGRRAMVGASFHDGPGSQAGQADPYDIPDLTEYMEPQVVQPHPVGQFTMYVCGGEPFVVGGLFAIIGIDGNPVFNLLQAPVISFDPVGNFAFPVTRPMGVPMVTLTFQALYIDTTGKLIFSNPFDVAFL